MKDFVTDGNREDMPGRERSLPGIEVLHKGSLIIEKRFTPISFGRRAIVITVRDGEKVINVNDELLNPGMVIEEDEFEESGGADPRIGVIKIPRTLKQFAHFPYLGTKEAGFRKSSTSFRENVRHSWGDGHQVHDFLSSNGSFFALAHEANHLKSKQSVVKQFESRLNFEGKPLIELSDDDLIQYIKYVSGEEELSWAGALRDLRRIRDEKGINLEPEFSPQDLLFQMNYCLGDYKANEARALYLKRANARG